MGSSEGALHSVVMESEKFGLTDFLTFGASARPAAMRPSGFFDGWLDALRHYNGRRDRTDTDRYYSDEYADKIVKRAKDPNAFVPIEIKLAK